MNFFKIRCTALWIGRALSVSAIIALPSMASDMPTSQYHIDAEEMKMVDMPSVLLPFNNLMFLYGVDASQFDLADFIYVNVPDLIDKEEAITHWAGYYSINPKVILTLMEMQSQLISSPTAEALNRPLGTLSDKQGFEEQLQDVLAQLSQRFYAYEESQLKGLYPPSTDAVNASSFALLALLNGRRIEQQQHAVMTGEHALGLDPFIEQFRLLFGNTDRELLMSSVAKNPLVADSTQSMQQVVPLANITASSLPPSNMLQMPWRQGYSWQSNGAHSHTGSGYPLSSIDVSYDWPQWGSPTYSVASAHDGTVNVLSRCQVRVTNANGWATNYYHMDQITVRNGQYVNQNTVMGIYANNKNAALCEGGSSTGPHLHFSLLKDGRHVSLQDVHLGQYRINIGSYNYDNNCSRFNLFDVSNNRTMCAWAPLYNAGSL